ncbi:MAG: type II toxin-antitoxin system VapC family toxin [Candidatus Eremiobacterota bacterium]
MSGADNQIFIDTNILVYASVTASPYHKVALKSLTDLYNTGAELWISRQVIREYLATLTRPQKFSQQIAISTLSKHIKYFETIFNIAEEGPQITKNLIALIELIPIGGSQIHDANIVATMQFYDIKHLLTHNESDFLRFEQIITILPLFRP